MYLCKRNLSQECKGGYKDCTDCVLDKIRAEALSLKINYTDFDSDVYRRGINDVLKIIDRFKVVADIDHTCHTYKYYLPGEYDGSCGSYICKNYSGWEEKEQES